jgi:uncharacterized protein YfdQ (DUF2303 family)
MATKSTTEAALIDSPAAYPGEALDAAIRAARLASPVIEGPDGRVHVALPDDFKLHEIQNHFRLPPYPAQRMQVDCRAALVTYANRFKDARSIIVADFDKLEITAHLDWHPHNQHEDTGTSGPQLHSVALKLRPSEEFARWNAAAGKLMEQADFARFLEENSTDVAYPEAATMIEISRDFEATVGQTYKSATRLDNGDRRLVFETETRAKNDVVIPQKFTLNIPIYNGEEPDTLTALFRWRAQAGGVALGFEWHRVEYQRQAHFEQIAAAAAEETGLPYLMGRRL